MNKSISVFTTKEKANKHEMLSPMLGATYNEMKELSKKKQTDTLNKLKVRMINRILEQVKDLLKEEPTAQFIDLLDDETLPTNSDAVLILAQFQAAMKQFKEKYYRYDSTSMEHKWYTK
jgi:hypothetical protein